MRDYYVPDTALKKVKEGPGASGPAFKLLFGMSASSQAALPLIQLPANETGKQQMMVQLLWPLHPHGRIQYRVLSAGLGLGQTWLLKSFRK